MFYFFVTGLVLLTAVLYMTTCFLVFNIIIFIVDDVNVCSFSISFVIPFENLKPTENQQGNLNQEKHSMSIIAHDTTCPVTVMFVQL